MITEDDFYLNWEDDGTTSAIILYVDGDEEAKKIRQEIIQALEIKKRLEEKLNWYSTWKSTPTCNGYIYRVLDEILG